MLREGRFGPYVTDGETNASLRKGDTQADVTNERAVELLAERRARGPAPKKARPAKKATSAKPAATKSTSTKSTSAKASTAKKSAATKSSTASKSTAKKATPRKSTGSAARTEKTADS